MRAYARRHSRESPPRVSRGRRSEKARFESFVSTTRHTLVTHTRRARRPNPRPARIFFFFLSLLRSFGDRRLNFRSRRVSPRRILRLSALDLRHAVTPPGDDVSPLAPFPRRSSRVPPPPEICLPTRRGRPFQRTDWPRAAIVGAHGATRVAVSEPHRLAERAAVTRGNVHGVRRESLRVTSRSHARVLGVVDGTVRVSSCVLARVRDTNHRAQHPRSTMGYIRDHELLYAKYLDRAIERILDDAMTRRWAVPPSYGKATSRYTGRQGNAALKEFRSKFRIFFWTLLHLY